MHEPYQVQLNGYQTVCNGCFAPFAYNQPLDRRFGNVNEFRTGAGSNIPAADQLRRKQFAGLTLRANYTYSHCLDEVSNGGLLPFSSLGILSPLPGDLRKEYGNCDYDVRHNLSAFGIYEIPFHSSHALLRQMLGGWQVSGTAILIAACLQRPERALHRQQPRHLSGQRAAVANRVPGRAALPQDRRPRRHPAGSLQWLNPTRLPLWSTPATGACAGGDSPANASSATPAATTIADRTSPTPRLPDKEDSITDMSPSASTRSSSMSSTTRTLPCPPTRPARRRAGDTNRLRRAYQHHLAADRTSWCRTWWRQFAAHDRVPG